MSAVYVAGPYAARHRLNGFAVHLRDLGVEVTASWLQETHDITPGTINAATDLTDADVSRHAATDLHDISRADLLVLITAEVSGLDPTTVFSGGRHVETGYALAVDVPVLVVGEPENVFHRLGPGLGVWVAPSWADALQRIGAHARDGLPLREALNGRPATVEVPTEALNRLAAARSTWITTDNGADLGEALRDVCELAPTQPDPGRTAHDATNDGALSKAAIAQGVRYVTGLDTSQIILGDLVAGGEYCEAINFVARLAVSEGQDPRGLIEAVQEAVADVPAGPSAPTYPRKEIR